MIEVDAVTDSLTVGNLRLASLAVDTVLTAHTLDVDVQVQLTHSGNDGLLTLAVVGHTEGRILTLETGHGLGEVGGVLALLGLDGQGYDRLRNEHGRHAVTQLTISESVTGSTIDTEHCANFTSANFVDLLHLVGVHAHDTRNLDLLVVASVEDVGTLAKSTLVHADVGQLAKVALFKLESQTDEGKCVVRNKLNRCFVTLLVESKVLNLGGFGR